MKQLLVFVFLLMFAASPVHASASDFRIRLGADTPREKAAEEQLKRLLDTYDVSAYVFTYSLIIRQYDVPHSHPVLTLNTVHLGDDANVLSTFLHEQFHWFASAFSTETDAAIADLKQIFPTVPAASRGGARDSFSTYAHLIVCLQEYDAIRTLMGEEEARRVLDGKRHYRWIYDQVIAKGDAIRSIVERHGLTLPLE